MFKDMPDLKLEKILSFILPFHELGKDVDENQCRETADQITNFYQKYMMEKDDKMSLYLLVTFIIWISCLYLESLLKF